MKKFKLEIEMGNAAFDGISRFFEAGRILAEVAHRVEEGAREGIVQDHNGNTVGSFWTEEGD